MTTERERFEAWTEWNTARDSDGNYESMHTATMWAAWQAALSAPPGTENRRAQPAAPAACSSCDGTGKISGLPCAWCMQSAAPADAAPSVAPEPTADVIYQELTDAECDEFRRHYGDFNSMIRLVHNDGHNRHAGRLIQHLGAVFNARFDALAAPPPRAPLTEEIESADNLLRHLGLDPERCRTEGGSLNVSRIKTLLADAAPSVAPEPVAWTLQSELDAAQTTCSAHLWFTNPRNSAWTALFTREQIAAHPPRAPLTEEFWLMLDTALDALKYHQEQTRPIELTRVTIAAVETFISAHGIGGK